MLIRSIPFWYYFYKDAKKSGYTWIISKDTIFVAALETPYYIQDTIELYMTGLEFLGVVFIPSFQHLKPFEPFQAHTIDSINPF